MNSEPIKVGIIGVGSEGSWAREAHVPAVRAVDGLELAAVAARGQERAEAVARNEDVPRAFGDAAALIADPELEVIVVGAPVPAHAELIVRALDAGKHVVTEWPLGIDSAQNEQLTAALAARGTVGAVGLQARHAAATLTAARLIGDGAIGRLLTVSVVSSTAGWGSVVPAAAEYLEDPLNGMHLTTIQTAHTLDLVTTLAGPLQRLSVLASIQYPEVRVAGTERSIRRRVPDHLAVQGEVGDGVPLVVEMRGGCAAERTPFRLLLHGTDGDLELVGGSPRGFQASALSLLNDDRPVELDDPFGGLPEAVRNVAGLYCAVEQDVRTGSRSAPSFEHAAQLGHLVDDLLTGTDGPHEVTASRTWPQR